jgi:hypothetical protein
VAHDHPKDRCYVDGQGCGARTGTDTAEGCPDVTLLLTHSHHSTHCTHPAQFGKRSWTGQDDTGQVHGAYQ